MAAILDSLGFTFLIDRMTEVLTPDIYIELTANKLLQICSQAVDKLCSHCLFPVVGTSLEQAVNNL